MTAPTPTAYAQAIADLDASHARVNAAFASFDQALADGRRALAELRTLGPKVQRLAAPSGETAPPADVIERVAEAIYAADNRDTPDAGPWAEAGQANHEDYRRLAMAAIKAMPAEVAAASVPAAPNAQATPADILGLVRLYAQAIAAAAFRVQDGGPMAPVLAATDEADRLLSQIRTALAAPSGEQPTTEPAGEVPDHG